MRRLRAGPPLLQQCQILVLPDVQTYPRKKKTTRTKMVEGWAPGVVVAPAAALEMQFPSVVLRRRCQDRASLNSHRCKNKASSQLYQGRNLEVTSCSAMHHVKIAVSREVGVHRYQEEERHTAQALASHSLCLTKSSTERDGEGIRPWEEIVVCDADRAKGRTQLSADKPMYNAL